MKTLVILTQTSWPKTSTKQAARANPEGTYEGHLSYGKLVDLKTLIA